MKETVKNELKALEMALRIKHEDFSVLDWGIISAHIPLSEDFIEEFQDKVNWEGVSIGQKLSEDFIEKFQDKIDRKTNFIGKVYE